MANNARKVTDGASGLELKLVTDATGTYVDLFGIRIYKLTAAVTANVTATTAPAGSLGKTSNATGRASVFVSDGAKWQFLTNA